MASRALILLVVWASWASWAFGAHTWAQAPEAPTARPGTDSTLAAAVVATIGAASVTVADVRALMDTQGPQSTKARSKPPSAKEVIQVAIAKAVTHAALAHEARRAWPSADAAHGPDAVMARAWLNNVVDAGRLCAQIPPAELLPRYRETAWRFVAPPAWTVQDIQLLCCRDPRACQTAEVKSCLQARARDAEDVAAALKDALDTDGGADDGAFAAFAQAHAQRFGGLSLKSYLFYHDAEVGAATPPPYSSRLQRVDAPIAEATARLDLGAWTGPVTTRFGYHFLRLVGRRDGINLPPQDLRALLLLRAEVCAEAIIAGEDRYIRDLLEPMPIEVHSGVIERAFGIRW